MSEQRASIPPERRIQRIQLEPYDDVVSIKDRLQFVKTNRILLVLPTRGNILQRKLDLVLIQREAARRGLRLALVTTDPNVAEHAQELNISAFYTVEQARTSRWNRPRNKVFIDRADRPIQMDPFEFEELQRRATRLKQAPSRMRWTVNRMTSGLIFGVAVIAFLFLIFALIPSASVTITPASDQINISIPMFADPNVDRPLPEKLTVPAENRRLIQDATAEIATTGRRNAENSLAEGVVSFTNNTGLATLIPAGTIIQTDTSPAIQFETVDDVALAARQGATTDVGIRALESSSGVQGNVGSDAVTVVTGSLAESVSVTNFNPTYGGGVTETAFATQADQDRLLNLVRQQLIQHARDFLLLSLDEGSSYLVNDSLKIVEERTLIYSAEVNEPAENISLTMQGVVEVTVIDLSAARIVADVVIKKDYIPDGRVPVEGTISYRRGEVLEFMPDGRIAFQMRVEGESIVDIDTQSVKELIVGLSARDAQAMIEENYLLDPRHPPQIDTFPGFFNRIPFVPARIRVEISPP